jgi:hypothetical protein
MSGLFHGGATLPQREAPVTHWLGGWVCPRTGLDIEKRIFLHLQEFEYRPFGRPAP